MNIRGGSKDRIDGKKKELKLELSKPKEEQNKQKIKRLKESIDRNKTISYKAGKIRRQRKYRAMKKK